MNDQNIDKILIGSCLPMGDVVWLCHILTAFRLNFPDAAIKIQDEPTKIRWAANTLIAPELKVEKYNPPEAGWDFKIHDIFNSPTYQFNGQAQQDRDEWSDHFQVYRTKFSKPPSLHIIDGIYKGLQEIFPGFKLPTAPVMPDIPPYTDFPPNFNRRPIVTIQTGTSVSTKNYPMNHWEDVAKSLVGAGFNVVFIGGPKDPKPSFINENIIDMVGKGELRDTIAMIRASAVHLAADTGTSHLAAAYRVPVVSLFGGYTYPTACKPYGDDRIITVLEKFKSLEKPQPSMRPIDVVRATLQMHYANAQRPKLKPFTLMA